EKLFATADAVIDQHAEHTPPQVKRYVFLDDLCGSGDQAADFNRDYVEPLRKKIGTGIEIWYFVLFATTDALEALNPPHTSFDKVRAVHELDNTFKCFSADSR